MFKVTFGDDIVVQTHCEYVELVFMHSSGFSAAYQQEGQVIEREPYLVSVTFV